MTGSYVLKQREPFEGTEFVPSSRLVRFTAEKPRVGERFVLYCVDTDNPEWGRVSGALLAEDMREYMFKILTPEGGFAEWASFAPVPGNTNINPVGNWLSGVLSLSYGTPIYDVSEVRQGLRV